MKKYGKAILFSLVALSAFTGLNADESGFKVGVVSFTACTGESQLGKQEQTSFESIKNQITALIKDKEKKMSELEAKRQDKDYMDTLSVEASEKINEEMRQLAEEMNNYQNQFYQILNQTHMTSMQKIHDSIQKASSAVAKEKHLLVVLNKENCCHTDPNIDITSLVITEMDKQFSETKEAEPTKTEEKK
ncbi:MAG: OmpH family outer membrane protein [Rhabdochlamydiaceae bacterium]